MRNPKLKKLSLVASHPTWNLSNKRVSGEIVERAGKSKIKVGNPSLKESEWKVQFQAKQFVKRYYGDLSQSTLKILIRQSRRKNINILSLIESRLDVVVYRLKFAKSIQEARHWIKHKYIKVDGRTINSINYILSEGEVVESNVEIGRSTYNYYSHELLKPVSVRSNNLNSVKNINYKKGIFIKAPYWKNIEFAAPDYFNAEKFLLYCSSFNGK